MKNSAVKVCWLVLLSLMTSLACHAGIVLSENFDALVPQLTAFSAGAFHTINGTNVDIVGGGVFGYLCVSPESGNCIDLDGSYGNPQGQLQSNMLFPAGSYYLSFDLIGSQRGTNASATVTFGNYNQTFLLGSADVTSGIVVNQLVTLSSPDYLLFVSNTPGNVGNLLDNVVVSTIPEPASLLLLGTGILGLAGAARRRFFS